MKANTSRSESQNPSSNSSEGLLNRRQFLTATAAASVAAAGVQESPTLARAANFSALEPAAQPIYLADLNRCEPQSALSRKRKKGCWQMLDYECSSVRGVMLAGNEESEA